MQFCQQSKRRKKMSKSIITKLSVITLMALLVTGCLGSLKGKSDEKLIDETMTEWEAAHQAKDLDRIMATFSEDYVSWQGGGKEDLREFIARGIDEGIMDNVEVKTENAVISIEGNNAKFGPVEFTSERGTFALDYKLQKENGKWLIITAKRPEQ